VINGISGKSKPWVIDAKRIDDPRLTFSQDDWQKTRGAGRALLT
jgi:hypothetical protein